MTAAPSPSELCFTNAAAFDPAQDFEAFLKQIPARWVVYLLSDAEGRPVQLLCVKNLRVSLQWRLGPQTAESPGPSRRVNYRDFVGRILWRRVDSDFEADWIYYEAARSLFPRTYQEMLGFRPAWFVHVDPHASFPRYVKTTRLDKAEGVYIGPLEDKGAAAKLIQLAEDHFDLCRYFEILTQSPQGKACAYKAMGKCPAPCDGSISVEAYRQMVSWSAHSLLDPSPLLDEQTARMGHAAAALRFESAGKIKALLAGLSQLGKGPFRHARRLEEFRFVSVQRGPREGTAKVFSVAPGRIECVGGMVAEGAGASDLVPLTVSDAAGGVQFGVSEAERTGLIAHHLFSPKKAVGVYLRGEELRDDALAKAFREVQKQAAKPVAHEEGEGLMKELQPAEP